MGIPEVRARCGKLAALALRPVARRALLRSCLRGRGPVDLHRGLAEAYRWICRAQDAGPDDGVSAYYDAHSGWAASYPETTGYIIPTLLTCARCLGAAEARARALRMAAWEVEIQLESGAVRSGLMGGAVGPAVFNTGQVLFGWVAALPHTDDPAIPRAIERAARWLVATQDPDGAWRQDLSLSTDSRVQTDNVRAAWGLALAGAALRERAWIAAAARNAEWAMTQQRGSGWFDHCTFDRARAPLLHTLAYTIEGLHALGVMLGREDMRSAAMRGLRPIVRQLRAGGSTRGEYAADWSSPVSWRCLTGDAQVALLLLRCADGEADTADWRDLAGALLRSLAWLQDLEGPFPETRGALSGSEPVWGRYGPFRYYNWGVKFHMDALLLHLHEADPQALERRDQLVGVAG